MCYMRFGVFYMRFLYVLCVWVCFISGYDLYHVLILQMSSPQPCVFQYAHSGMHAKKNNASCKLLVKTHLTGYVATRPAAPVSSCIHQASWLTVSHQPRGCPSVLRAFVMPRPPSMMSPSFSFLARGLQVIPRLEVLRKTRSSNWNVLWITGYRCSQDFFFLPPTPLIPHPTPPLYPKMGYASWDPWGSAAAGAFFFLKKVRFWNFGDWTIFKKSENLIFGKWSAYGGSYISLVPPPGGRRRFFFPQKTGPRIFGHVPSKKRSLWVVFGVRKIKSLGAFKKCLWQYWKEIDFL